MLQDESWAAPEALCTPCVSVVCYGCIDGSLPIAKIILIILFGLMRGVNASKGTQKSYYKL